MPDDWCCHILVHVQLSDRQFQQFLPLVMFLEGFMLNQSLLCWVLWLQYTEVEYVSIIVYKAGKSPNSHEDSTLLTCFLYYLPWHLVLTTPYLEVIHCGYGLFGRKFLLADIFWDWLDPSSELRMRHKTRSHRTIASRRLLFCRPLIYLTMEKYTIRSRGLRWGVLCQWLCRFCSWSTLLILSHSLYHTTR